MSLQVQCVNFHNYKPNYLQSVNQKVTLPKNEVNYGAAFRKSKTPYSMIHKKMSSFRKALMATTGVYIGKEMLDTIHYDSKVHVRGNKPFEFFEDKETLQEVIKKFISSMNYFQRLGFENTTSMLPFEELINCGNFKAFLTHYKQLTAKGFNEKNAFIISNIRNLRTKNLTEISKLIDKIDKNNPNDRLKLSEELSEFLNSERNKDLNLTDFNNYIDKIDFEELYKIAPRIKNFRARENLLFFEYYYRKNITKFDEKTLSFNSDFTEFLAENYVNSEQLNNLLIIKPLTSRKIGELPKNWVQESKKDIASEKIYSAIESFRELVSKNPHENHYFEVKNFEKELENILNKKVFVTEIGKGGFGSGYRISVEGANDTCLKIFHNRHLSKEARKKHGQYIEPQLGLFANRHSNKFVKMFFGKVAGEIDKDGFLVTQFLSDSIKPIECEKIKSGYEFIPLDVESKGKEHNFINNKIIDFGNILIKKFN